MQVWRRTRQQLAPNGSLNQLSRQLGKAAAKAARARLTASPDNLARQGYSCNYVYPLLWTTDLKTRILELCVLKQRQNGSLQPRLVFCALFSGRLGPIGPHTLEFFFKSLSFLAKSLSFLVLFLEFLAKFLNFLLHTREKISCTCQKVANLTLFTANYNFKGKIL